MNAFSPSSRRFALAFFLSLLAPSWLWAANSPPTITPISDRTINENTSTPAIAFTIGDDTTQVAELDLSASSSDTGIVKTGNIVFGGGTGPNRTVTVTPDQNAHGTVTISITVTDTNGAATTEDFPPMTSAQSPALEPAS